MLFKLYKPSYPLSVFIESFYYYREFNPAHSVDRFLPDGNINIVFDLTDYPKFIYDNETLKEIQACKNVWFSGIRNRFITIPSGKDSEMFIINFHKGKAYPFVQMPLNELTDSVVDGELVLTSEILNLREKIMMVSDSNEKFRLVEEYLLKYYLARLNNVAVVDFAVGKILKSPSSIMIKDIYDKTGHSQKHFIKLFKENVGLTPKGFLKIIRFQKAIQEIEEARDPNWSTIAFEAGYYDQAHFIHDFKIYSGFTPESYLKVKSDQLNYIPVS